MRDVDMLEGELHKNIVIWGSRSLKDKRVKDIILGEIEKRNPDYIITSGEPRGVCEVARKVARECSIPLLLFFVNKKKCVGKYDHRNKEILKHGDFFVIVHDGISKGTANELELIKESGKPFEYYKLDKIDLEELDGLDEDIFESLGEL